MNKALLLMAYGSPEKKEEIMDYLRDVFGGRDPPEFSIKETNSKYSAFGYKSPSSEILRSLIGKMRSNFHDYEIFMAFKHWNPSIREIAKQIKEGLYDHIVAFPLFPIRNNSIMKSYLDPLEKISKNIGLQTNITAINGMSKSRILTTFWINSLKSLAEPEDFVLFSAHSLPHTVEEESDYVLDLKSWTDKIAFGAKVDNYGIGFQSRGSYGKVWLEPSIYDVLEQVQNKGYKRIVTVPVGFLYDHLEVLYDLDMLFGEKVKLKSMGYKRAQLPNDTDDAIRSIKECVEMA